MTLNKCLSTIFHAVFIIFATTTLFADEASNQAQKDGQHPVGGMWGIYRAQIKDPSLPQVLIIGDSIVGGCRGGVVKALQGKANVDVWLTPEWLSPALCQQVSALLIGNNYQVIHFNESGLHAYQKGRVPEGQYGPLMLQYLTVIKKLEPDAKLIWASTTPVTVLNHPGELDDLDKVISDHNATCAAIMPPNHVDIDDLHQLMLGHLDLAKGDRWHWNQQGFRMISEAVTNSILSALNTPAPSTGKGGLSFVY